MSSRTTEGLLAVHLAKRILAKSKGEAVYHGISISKLDSMKMAIERTKEALPKITAPLLVIHSNMMILYILRVLNIYNRANSNGKTLMWLGSTQHEIDAVEDANIISEQIISFINKAKAAY